MTGAVRRGRSLILLSAVVLAACGTLTTTGSEVLDGSTGVVTSEDGTATVSYPPDRVDETAEITIEPLDLASDGATPAADATELVGDVLEGLGADPAELDTDDPDAFELGLFGGWRVAFSESWFEAGEDSYGIGSHPVFGLTTDFWTPIPWQPRLLPLDVVPSEEPEAQDRGEPSGTPVPVPIIVRVDEEGAATVLPGTVVTPHAAGTTVTAPLDGGGTVAAFGGTVAVSVAPERVRALVGEVFRTRVTLHIADDFGGTFRHSAQSAVATGSANVRPVTTSVNLANRDGASAELEFVCREPGLGRFGVTLDITSVSMITFGQFEESMFEDRGTAMRLGVVECLDPNDPRLPESVIDDLQPVFVGLPRIDDAVDPSDLPTARAAGSATSPGRGGPSAVAGRTLRRARDPR